MVKIRLSRQGKKNKPFYRIVAIDEQKKRSGEALEIIGYWNPVTSDFKIDKNKLKIWVEKGAQITPAVKKLIK